VHSPDEIRESAATYPLTISRGEAGMSRIVTYALTASLLAVAAILVALAVRRRRDTRGHRRRRRQHQGQGRLQRTLPSKRKIVPTKDREVCGSGVREVDQITVGPDKGVFSSATTGRWLPMARQSCDRRPCRADRDLVHLADSAPPPRGPWWYDLPLRGQRAVEDDLALDAAAVGDGDRVVSRAGRTASATRIAATASSDAVRA